MTNPNLTHILNEDSERQFCEYNKISEEMWERAGLAWRDLVEIARDHDSQIPSLSASASMYSNLIQVIDGVHSVRWRVKDPLHLAAKIVRKRAEGREGYADISIENYFKVVTDLVGIRALHLFKDDFRRIHEKLAPFLADKENPVANMREGDSPDFAQVCRDLNLEVKQHSAGYRSIHYVKTVKPLSRELHIEIQLRTVFEEGWSEVDHTVRYPNFSSDPLVAYASLILNRLSGMADELSTYAMRLAQDLDEKSNAIQAYQRDQDAALQRIDELVVALQNAQQDGAMHRELATKFENEVKNIRRTYEVERLRLERKSVFSQPSLNQGECDPRWNDKGMPTEIASGFTSNAHFARTPWPSNK